MYYSSLIIHSYFGAKVVIALTVSTPRQKSVLDKVDSVAFVHAHDDEKFLIEES